MVGDIGVVPVDRDPGCPDCIDGPAESGCAGIGDVHDENARTAAGQVGILSGHLHIAGRAARRATEKMGILPIVDAGCLDRSSESTERARRDDAHEEDRSRSEP